jgi:hypothetical protein
LPGRQVALAPRTIEQQEKSGSGGLSLRGPKQRLSTLRPQTRVLPRESEPRPWSATTPRKHRPSVLPGKDGQRGGPGAISPPWKSGRVLPRVDQKQARPAAVSCRRLREGSNRTALGPASPTTCNIGFASTSCEQLLRSAEESKTNRPPSGLLKENQKPSTQILESPFWRSCHQVFSQLLCERGALAVDLRVVRPLPQSENPASPRCRAP